MHDSRETTQDQSGRAVTPPATKVTVEPVPEITSAVPNPIDDDPDHSASLTGKSLATAGNFDSSKGTHSTPEPSSQSQPNKRFLSRLLNIVRPAPSVKKLDMIWENGEPLSDAQFDNLVRFNRRAKRTPITPGARIHIWSKNELGEVVGEQPYMMKVGSNGSFEEELLSQSRVDTKPREMLGILIHDVNGTVYDTNIRIEGGSRSVDFSKAQYALHSLLRGSAGDISTIEIVHTHPWYALTVTQPDGERRARPNELSREDFYQAIEFSMRFPPGKTVLMRAAVPNGFNCYIEVPTGRTNNGDCKRYAL